MRIANKIDLNWSITEISKALDISHQTISNIAERYLETGSMLPKKRGGDKKSLLTSEEKGVICSWVGECCTLTLKELKLKVEENFQKMVSISTINTCLKEFHFSLKMVSLVPDGRNRQSTRDQREAYAKEVRLLEVSIFGCRGNVS